jgi:hypothetical protein
MIEIIEAIDAYTTAKYPQLNMKLWGFCELAHNTSKNQSDQPIPMTAYGYQERKQVALDDRYDFITWCRWVSPVSYRVNEDWSFGRNQSLEASITLRIVVAHKVELGETLIFDFARNIPGKMNLAGFQYVFLDDSSPSIDPDHETIYRTELGKTEYEKHRIPWNLYTVDAIFNFIQCEELTP